MMDVQTASAAIKRVRPRDRWPFTLEKWYVDTLSEDGLVLILYFGRVSICGRLLARFTADLFLPNGDVVRGHAIVDRPKDDGDAVIFGPAVMEPGRIVWQTEGLSGELHLAPRYEPVELRAPLLRAGDRSLTWHVEIPDADVTGTLRWNGRELKLSGRGYRDRVWFDIAPWRFPIRELRWGRVVAGPSAALWVQAQTSGSPVESRWLNGRLVEDDWPVEIVSSTSLLETSVADVEGLKLSVFRPLVRLITGDPYEIKWSARASIGGTPGVGIHERVRWHGGLARS